MEKINIYQRTNSIIQSESLLIFAKELIELSHIILNEKSKKKYLNNFYSKLFEYSMMETTVSDILNEEPCNYLIYKGKTSVRKYIALNLPEVQSPIKTLKKIIDLSESIINDFCDLSGEDISNISDNKLNEILLYLDKKWDFSKTIFSDRKAMFFILNVTNKNQTNQCSITSTPEKKLFFNFFLYENNYEEKKITPEGVFFHELGHAIHARLTNGSFNIPDGILHFLDNTCMPNIIKLSDAQKNEVFADIIAMGLMYNTPYSIYDPFDKIHKNDKKAFSIIVDKIFDSIKENLYHNLK